jgi:2-haloacid dehalogenase
MAKRAGLPWDAILGAELAMSPCPRLICARSRPDEVCLVAARNGDLAAARSCGLRTAFIPRPTEHGPGQTTDLKPDQDWDIVANDLQDLAGKLGL